MDIRNLLLGKELSVCLFQRLYFNFHFYKPGSRTQYLRLSAPVMFRFPQKKNSVTLSYKIKLHNPSFNPTNALNRISALRGPCSNQLNYRTKIINKIYLSSGQCSISKALYLNIIYKTAFTSSS